MRNHGKRLLSLLLGVLMLVSTLGVPVAAQSAGDELEEIVAALEELTANAQEEEAGNSEVAATALQEPKEDGEDAAADEEEEPVVQAESTAMLTSLEVADSSHSGIALEPAFDPDIAEYTLRVQEDILGVQFKAEADGEVEITGSMIANSFPDGVELHDDGSVTVLTISPDHFDDYDSEGHITATITVTGEEGETAVYTVNIIRADGSWTYELFEQFDGDDSYYDEATGAYVPYNIYVPDNLQPGENLPVVYALHGGGQASQPLNMILKKYQMSTIWAMDSEADPAKRAIVLAPQANGAMNPELTSGWSMTVDGEFQTTDLAEAAYNLLLKTLDDYSDYVDPDRVYVTGMSMGGGGTMAVVTAHPETFAAAFVNCSGAGISEAQARAVKDVPFYIVQAEGDLVVSVANARILVDKLRDAGATVNYVEYPLGSYFYTTAHFSWVAAYADQSIREWLFGQSRSSVSGEARLRSLELTDNAHISAMAPDFDPEITEYTMVVEADVGGVLVDAKAPAGYSVIVAGSLKTEDHPDGIDTHPNDVSPESYGGAVTVHTITRNFPAGSALNGGTNPEYEEEGVITATITVVEDADASNSTEYTVTITRKSGKDLYDLFEQKVFTDSTGTELNYNIYVPSDIEPDEQLPVVYTLHGSSRRAPWEAPDMILKKSNQATVWARDSKEGIRRCIVIAPQSNVDGWRMPSATNQTPSDSDNAAYELLLAVIDEYNADANRVYVTGLSMGGGGTWSAILNHPDTFAAAFVTAFGAEFTDEQLESVKHIPMLNIWSEHELYQAFVTNNRPLAARMEAIGHVDYNWHEYPSDYYLYESGHFSWAPAYHNEEYREWLFAQSRSGAGDEPKLASLQLTDSGHLGVMTPDFDPEVKEYSMTVDEGILGVLVNAEAAPGYSVTVTGTLNSESYPDGVEVHTDGQFDNGTTVLTLTRDVEYGPGVTNYEYDEGSVVTATITVTDDADESNSTDYTVTITRKPGKEVYDLFEQDSFTASNGTTIEYNLYVPSDIEPDEQLPVVYTLHGSGQRSNFQGVDMVLKRTNHATEWAKDSEAGIRRCIVIAPQSNEDQWLTSNDNGDPTTWGSGEAAYELLRSIMDEYDANVDRNRIYATGLSMGGRGTLATILDHPNTFAGVFIHAASAAVSQEALETIKHLPIRNVWAANDGAGVTDTSREISQIMERIGAVDYDWYEYPAGTYLYETEHFSWVPAYNNVEWREWLFAQSRDGDVQNELTVTFEDRGTVIKTVSVIEGNSVGASQWPASPVRAGYSFTGWYTAYGVAYSYSTRIEQSVTLYAGWQAVSGTGGSSSGGGNGGGSGGTNTNTVPIWLSDTVSAATGSLTETVALSAVDSALRAGASTVRFQNPGTVSQSTLQAIAARAGNTALTIHADSMNGSAVDVRLYVAPAMSTASINLAASTINARSQGIRALFAAWFANDLTVLSLEQDGAFGQEVEVAVKLSADLAGKELALYRYNRTANTYTKLPDQTYRIDANSYLHFTISAGGDYVISDGALHSK